MDHSAEWWATNGARSLSITLGEVAAFVAVMDQGSFTAAATILHLSQPGVSARIKRLERSLGGAPLLDRSVKRATLTRQGRAFLPMARDLLATLERAVVAGAERRDEGLCFVSQHGRTLSPASRPIAPLTITSRGGELPKW